MRFVAFALAIAMITSPAIAQDSSIEDLQILSDTQGYNFASYFNNLRTVLRKNWSAVMPEIALKGEKGRAVVTFTIIRDGKIQDFRVDLSTGNQELDRAAESAIKTSSPFPHLPESFKGDRIILRVTFLYNLKPAAR
jgi:TonB family protein